MYLIVHVWKIKRVFLIKWAFQKIVSKADLVLQIPHDRRSFQARSHLPKFLFLWEQKLQTWLSMGFSLSSGLQSFPSIANVPVCNVLQAEKMTPPPPRTNLKWSNQRKGTVQQTGHVDPPGTTEETETDPIDDLFSWLMATPPPANGKFKNGRTFSGYVFCILSSFSKIRINLINYLHSQPPGTLSITVHYLYQYGQHYHWIPY